MSIFLSWQQIFLSVLLVQAWQVHRPWPFTRYKPQKYNNLSEVRFSPAPQDALAVPGKDPAGAV
jgi:hypothetical protein